MAEPEVAGGQTQRVAREYVSRPGASAARHYNRIHTASLVHVGLGSDKRSIRASAGRIVTARHIHFYVAKAARGEVLLEGRERLSCSHIRHEPKVELGHGPVRQNGLAARASVSSDQSFDVDRGTRHQELQSLLPAGVAH